MKYKVGQKLWIWFDPIGYKSSTQEIIVKHVRLLPVEYRHSYISDELYEIEFINLKEYNKPKKIEISEATHFIYLTEEEVVARSFSRDIFISSKNCLKSELKYIEREEKLKRILNEI